LLKNYVSVPSVVPGSQIFARGGSRTLWGFRETPLFEDLLNRCVEDRSLIGEIDGLVKACSGDHGYGDIVPAEFLGVWSEIKAGLTEDSQ
jgi:hypothetical protein